MTTTSIDANNDLNNSFESISHPLLPDQLATPTQQRRRIHRPSLHHPTYSSPSINTEERNGLPHAVPVDESDTKTTSSRDDLADHVQHPTIVVAKATANPSLTTPWHNLSDADIVRAINGITDARSADDSLYPYHSTLRALSAALSAREEWETARIRLEERRKKARDLMDSMTGPERVGAEQIWNACFEDLALPVC